MKHISKKELKHEIDCLRAENEQLTEEIKQLNRVMRHACSIPDMMTHYLEAIRPRDIKPFKAFMNHPLPCRTYDLYIYKNYEEYKIHLKELDDAIILPDSKSITLLENGLVEYKVEVVHFGTTFHTHFTFNINYRTGEYVCTCN